jgi:hypothetical protein
MRVTTSGYVTCSLYLIVVYAKGGALALHFQIMKLLSPTRFRDTSCLTTHFGLYGKIVESIGTTFVVLHLPPPGPHQ